MIISGSIHVSANSDVAFFFQAACVYIYIYIHTHNGQEFEQTLGDSERQRSLVCSSPWGCIELDTTLQMNIPPLYPFFCQWTFRLLPCLQPVSQFSHSVMSDSLQVHRLQHAWPPRPSPTLGVCSNSCPLSLQCHPTISSSVLPFSSCLQSFPASGSLPVSQLFTSGGQSIGVSASASVLPMNIQD